jgi:hypothetical protein
VRCAGPAFALARSMILCGGLGKISFALPFTSYLIAPRINPSANCREIVAYVFIERRVIKGLTEGALRG